MHRHKNSMLFLFACGSAEFHYATQAKAWGHFFFTRVPGTAQHRKEQLSRRVTDMKAGIFVAGIRIRTSDVQEIENRSVLFWGDGKRGRSPPSKLLPLPMHSLPASRLKPKPNQETRSFLLLLCAIVVL